MSFIPGLSIRPDDTEDDRIINIPTFTGVMHLPGYLRYGNCRPLDDFEKLGTIREGSFGILYKCKDKRKDILYTMKKLKNTHKDGDFGRFLAEISILSLLKHNNIVNFDGVVAGKALENNYLLLDYCVMNLHDLIEKKLDEVYERDVVKFIFKQLIQGVEFIHSSLIIHRDINCWNIEFTEYGTLKIGGFHYAQYYKKGKKNQFLTDLNIEPKQKPGIQHRNDKIGQKYRAPEFLFHFKDYGPPADMWSVGCILAQLLLKKPLFTGESETDVLRSIFEVIGTPHEAIWPGFDQLLANETSFEIKHEIRYSSLKKILNGVPDVCITLLQDLIAYCPDSRLTASGVLDDPYIKDPPAECSEDKMALILKKALSEPQTYGPKPMEIGSD